MGRWCAKQTQTLPVPEQIVDAIADGLQSNTAVDNHSHPSSKILTCSDYINAFAHSAKRSFRVRAHSLDHVTAEQVIAAAAAAAAAGFGTKGTEVRC